MGFEGTLNAFNCKFNEERNRGAVQYFAMHLKHWNTFLFSTLDIYNSFALVSYSIPKGERKFEMDLVIK